MTACLDGMSPFYVAYSSQSEIINNVIEKAIVESAAKIGDLITEVYSISAASTEEKLAA